MIRARRLGTVGHFRNWLALLLLLAFSLWLALASALAPVVAQNSAAPFWAPSEAEISNSKDCVDSTVNALEKIEKNESFSYSCHPPTSAKVEGYHTANLYLSSFPYNPMSNKKYAAIIPNNGEYHVLNFTLEWSWYGRNLPSDVVPPVNLNNFAEGLSGAKRFTNKTYWYDQSDWPPPVPAANNLCPAVVNAVDNIYSAAADKRLPKGAFVTECVLANGPYLSRSHWKILIIATLIVPRSKPAGTAMNCTTDVLKGSWRAENAALAKTGHAVTFAAAPNVPKHDGGQVAQRGAFSTYPAHKNLLQLLPNPLFTSARGYPAGKDQCLIPVVSQRDSGNSRSAVLIDTKASTLRFVTERAYRWESNAYRLNAVDSNLVGGMEGRWLRGAAPALAKTCTPADFNGRWDRSDGARVTIRGAGTQGVGGTGSMDDHPENWVRGQDKYTSMRMKSACVYTAKCYASQRTTINGRPDFKMVETACELVIDPETKTLRERGTSNSYSYTKAGAGAAARKPPSAVTPPEPAQPSQAVQSLNSEQAAAAKREIQAYEARKKAIADEQAAKEAAYRKALADREALIAENNRRASEARAKWEASAAACLAGDQSQCAPQPQR